VSRFVGEVDQVPPMYSALKRDGVPLYRLARSGIEVERRARRVLIEELVVERYRWPELDLLVRCSKGTYVRTLVEDIAVAAGTVGHVAALRRLAVSPFREEDMRTFAEVEAAAAQGTPALDRLLLPAEAVLENWPAARLGAVETAKVAHGQAVAADPALPCGHVKVYSDAGQLIAIGLVTAERRLAPVRVFIR
jgi:tRNA pseudouridine55 synthase